MTVQIPRPQLLLVAVTLVGCVATAEDQDGASDEFLLDGKADGQLAEGSPTARGILAVVNELTKEALDDRVGLAARPARNIYAHRTGADGLEGTADDDPFDTLAELDAIPYVGPVALEKLRVFAHGNGYVDEPARNYEAVWSISHSDAWAIGAAGLVEHWNGATWTQIASGVTVDLHDVWASGPNDVWIVGNDATLLRWNGSALTRTTVPAAPDQHLWGVSGSAASSVWIVGGRSEWNRLVLRWNGTRFEEVAYTCQVAAGTVHVVSPTEVYTGGSQETLCRFDGTGWTDISHYLTSYPVSVSDIWRAPTGTVYSVLGGDVWRRVGGSWSKMFSMPVEDGEGWNDISSLVAFAENDLWVTGEGGHVARWNGSSWQVTHVPGGAHYLDLEGTSSTDLWAVGFGARAHFDGVIWTEELVEP